MDVLKGHFTIVLSLDDFLESILNENIICELNLSSVFKDVILVSNNNSIKQFNDKKMIESNLEYGEFLAKLKRTQDDYFQAKKIDNFIFNRHFFGEARFEYLFNLIQQDYFFTLLKCFCFYKIDHLYNCYLQFGDCLRSLDELPDKPKKRIDFKKICLESNLQFVIKNQTRIGNFKGAIKQVECDEIESNRIKNNDQEDKIEQELDCLSEFLDKNSNEFIKFLKEKAIYLSTRQSSYLNINKSIKLEYFNFDFVNQRLERDRIYQNLDFRRTRLQFLNQFQNVDAQQLFNSIFKKDTKSKICRFKFDRVLIKMLSSFIEQHNNCALEGNDEDSNRFMQFLNEECDVPTIQLDEPEDEYYLSEDLFHITKQDEVANYIKRVLTEILPNDLFGKGNFKCLLKWFKLIVFQNGMTNQSS